MLTYEAIINTTEVCTKASDKFYIKLEDNLLEFPIIVEAEEK